MAGTSAVENATIAIHSDSSTPAINFEVLDTLSIFSNSPIMYSNNEPQVSTQHDITQIKKTCNIELVPSNTNLSGKYKLTYFLSFS